MFLNCYFYLMTIDDLSHQRWGLARCYGPGVPPASAPPVVQTPPAPALAPVPVAWAMGNGEMGTNRGRWPIMMYTIYFKRNFWCKRDNYLIFELGSFSSEPWWWWWWWWWGGGDDGYFEIACTLHAMRLLQLIQICSCRNSLPVHKQGHKKGGLPQRTMLIF